MNADKTIFGLRFGANEELVPDPDDLNAFLANTKKDDGSGPHSGDLTHYRGLLKDFDAFEKNRLHDVAHHNVREKMFYGVLGRSFFVNRVLLSSVAQYKYHLHTLGSLDFRKPTAFIRSAEEEMSRLNPKKKPDADKLARLQGMVDDRNKTLKALQKRWADLIAELSDIALYLKDNLTRIEQYCEASIVILVELQVGQKKENELIEDIKMHFKEHLRDYLHQGSITKEHLETAKKDVATLTQEMSSLFREDIYALTKLFEAIHDHAARSAREISALMEKTGGRKGISVEEYRELYTQIEQSLVSLVSDFRFEMKPARVHSTTAYESILVEKRKEALDYIFGMLERERRSEKNRRSGEDRREFDDPDYDGPERRGHQERRVGKKPRHS
jgi:hypothetical protein